MRWKFSPVLSAVTALTLLCGCAGEAASSGDDSSAVTSASQTTANIPAVTGQPPKVTLPEAEAPTDEALLSLGGGEIFEASGGHYPVYSGTTVRFLPSGESFYEALLEELDSAEDFILMEYFIIEQGEMLDGVLDIIREKTAAGVEVKIIPDELASEKGIAEVLREAGAECEPYRSSDGDGINYRDHRKITVVDGKSAFMGGANIADEYINKISPYGHWVDAAVLMKGEAVRTCTELFFEQWKGGAELESAKRYIDASSPAESDGYVMPFGTSYTEGARNARAVYLDMICRAEKSLYITAPYLTIDSGIERELGNAVSRGVDTVLVIPGIADKQYSELISRQHWRNLLELGVKLYRYDPGFVHAKVALCDGELAMVGSINLNSRSFYLDCECAAYLFGCSAAEDIRAFFDGIIPLCTELGEKEIPELSPAEKLEAGLLDRLAPVM